MKQPLIQPESSSVHVIPLSIHPGAGASRWARHWGGPSAGGTGGKGLGEGGQHRGGWAGKDRVGGEGGKGGEGPGGGELTNSERNRYTLVRVGSFTLWLSPPHVNLP
jgi:hypothetical protein